MFFAACVVHIFRHKPLKPQPEQSRLPAGSSGACFGREASGMAVLPVTSTDFLPRKTDHPCMIMLGVHLCAQHTTWPQRSKVTQ